MDILIEVTVTGIKSDTKAKVQAEVTAVFLEELKPLARIRPMTIMARAARGSGLMKVELGPSDSDQKAIQKAIAFGSWIFEHM